MKNIAVLISDGGTGSNLQAIIDAVESKKINLKIAVVVSDTPKALGLIRAKKHHLPTLIFDGTSKLEKILKSHKVKLIALTGWKKIISDGMISTYKNAILNVHPGLIPDTMNGTVLNPDGTKALWNKGKYTTAAIGNFLDKKATYAGSSIHFLSHEFDFGPVLARCFEKIKPTDTVESLYGRLKKKEHEMYVQILGNYSNNL